MDVWTAVNKMRKLSDANIPFSMTYIGCDLTNDTGGMLKAIPKCILRTGLNKDQSNKHRSLIGYYDLDKKANRWFYLPLLQSFNNIEVI